MFLGTGACVVNAVSGGRLGVAGVGLIWGALVWLLATLSGAHMNPAVTVASGLPAREQARYALAQTFGALAASLALLLIFRGRAGDLGATTPAAGAAVSFFLEFMMTTALVLAVLRAPPKLVPAAAGLIVVLASIFGGPLTGASMNPARSLAPALVSGRLGGLWIYLSAPLLGAFAAAALTSASRRN
ncbi:MAG: aquaporin [Elusimicrobia bacterium]|nr:aquaporin [Elusimicrobiota bacterium]